jgi:hypothetical protein
LCISAADQLLLADAPIDDVVSELENSGMPWFVNETFHNASSMYLFCAEVSFVTRAMQWHCGGSSLMRCLAVNVERCFGNASHEATCKICRAWYDTNIVSSV